MVKRLKEPSEDYAMGRWTDWRCIAFGREWYDEPFDYTGPACYELGTGGPRGGSIQPHYVGETKNERDRIACYARSGSHLSKTINWHLRQGWALYYRSRAYPSKALAKQAQDNLLARWIYDWNRLLNVD
jgi:hypothetical protein